MSRIVSARPQQTLLPAVQAALLEADEALLTVAFVDTKGLHLLEKEMRTVGTLRILATSRFDRLRSRTDIALSRAVNLGATAQLLNPTGGSTFHPKMYLARRGRAFSGVIGSANLTFGLAGNFEAGVVVAGSEARDAWALAEELWENPEAVPWAPLSPVEPDELDARLYDLLAPHVHPGMTIQTLGSGGVPNTILAFSRTGATVATRKSPGGKQVEARMIQIGYDALVTSPGMRLTNPYLLNTLRVHRSSFIIALLAALPMVRQLPGRPITVELLGRAPVPASSISP